MKTVLIRGGGFINKGAEALLLTARDQLRRRMSDLSFRVEIPDSQVEFVRAHGMEPVRRSAPFRGISKLLLKRKVQRVLCRLGDPEPIFDALTRLRPDPALPAPDAVLDVSGYSYHDGGVERLVAQALSLKRCPVPYVFLPQAWGPFRTEPSRVWVRCMLKRAARVYSRDGESSRHLRQCGFERFEEAPDIALAFEGKGEVPEYVRRLEARGRPLVGIAPNMRVYERMKGQGLENEYLSALIRLCRRLVDERKASVALIANEVHPPGMAKDDQDLCEWIRDALRDERCDFERRARSAAEIRAAVGRLDLLVGSRFHTLVFGLSQQVPVLAMGWSHKYRELLASFGMADGVQEHDRGFDLDELAGRAFRLLDEPQTCRERIGHHLKNHQRAISGVFDALAHDLARGASPAGHGPV